MLHDPDLVSIQETRSKVEKAYAAFQELRRFSQQQLDAICERMAAAGRDQAQRLAEMAVEDTGYGNVKDKVAKNLLCADLLWRTIRPMKLVGMIREIPEEKVVEYGVPMGVVAAILPTTNPTSTAIYKILISVKAGNTIVISPHPRARNCTCQTADLLYKAALEAGAPEDIIQCVTTSTIDATNALMKHHRTAVILSTGGAGIVRAAYSSGKPAFGVGPGNVPVLIEESADIPDAVAKAVEGKAFDYGTVCSSEQAVVAVESLRGQILAELQKNKAYLCNQAQGESLARLLVTPRWTINPDCVGQAPTKIAKMGGFEAPADTAILAVEIKGVGKEHPLSMEKLSPVLALLFVKNHEEAIETCQAIMKFGGLGHTCVIFSRNEERIREFGMRMPAFRVLVNTPAPHGSVGITTNLLPSMTLGCGAMAGNVTGDNVGPQHLMNIKRLAYAVRRPEEALRLPTPAQVAVPAPRDAVVEAVERYLAQRGVRAPAPAAPPVTASTIAGISAQVVDRFFSERAKTAPAAVAPPAAAAPVCACSLPKQGEAAAPAPAQPAPPMPPAPEIRIVDFVCEADVRTAIAEGKKIYIGPKTIVTPAARELGDARDVLVMAQRA